MASRTRTQIRRLAAQQFMPHLVTGTTVSMTATTVVDIPTLGAYEDNYFNGAWVYLTTESPVDVQVTDFVQSTGTLTTIPSDSGRTGAVAYEVLPYPGTAFNQAIDEAILHAYDQGWLARELWMSHWLTGSPIYNSEFGYWTGATALSGWTATTVTIGQVLATSTNFVLPGEIVLSLSGAAGTVDLNAQYERFLSDFRGHQVDLRGWAYSTVASELRFRLLVDGSVVASTGYHSGGSTWEVLELATDYDIADGATRIGIRVDAAGVTGTNYAGAVWLEGGPVVREYPFPIGLMPDGPDMVYSTLANIDIGNTVADVRSGPQRVAPPYRIHRYQDADANTETGLLVFPGSTPTAGRRLWLSGRAPLSIPTADSSTGGNVEVGQMESLLLAKLTAMKLIEKDKSEGGIDQKLARRYSELAADLFGRPGVPGLVEGMGVAEAHAVPLRPGW